MKITNKSTVTYINHMGSDLDVVNAARVSFHKESKEFNDKDENLIKYLATHGHWSPFAHTFVSFRIKTPIFVARQLVKHQVGLSWNEVSRRYVDEEPEFYFPKEWRGKPVNAKQGSSGIFPDNNPEYKLSVWVESQTHEQLNLYLTMIKDGVAPEQARMILPQNMMTEFIWSGSLYAFARVCNQRLDDHAQKETQEVAQQILKTLKELFPVSCKYLINHE